MLTIFTIPKPFKGGSGIIQRNAILSWLELRPTCDVILFGDDEGVGDFAEEFKVLHISSIKRNELGTPLLNSAFDLAQQISKYDILMYSNADIIFMPDLIKAISRIDKSSFLLCGRRWDLDVKEEIDFEDNEWSGKLHKRVEKEGKRHGLSGMDYFIFPRNLVNMPPFAVGRPGWDSWLVYDMRTRKIPVIDATESVTIIHQNHDYSHSKFGGLKSVTGPEYDKNIKLARGYTCMLTLRDADWVMDKNGLRRPRFPTRIFSMLSMCYPWRVLLSVKRKLQQ